MGRTAKDVDGAETKSKSMEKLTVLVETNKLNELYVIMGREGIKNISEVTRKALSAYIDSYKDKNREDAVVLSPAPKVMDAINSLVDLGEFNSKEEAVEYALRRYIEEYKTKYLQEYKEYDEEVEKEKKKKEELEVMV